MKRVVNVHEAKTHLSKWLDEVESGHEVVLARNGKPCAKLVLIGMPKQRPMGFVKGRVTKAFFEPLEDEELSAWG
jgi:prevent-host-death family protein